MKPTWAILTGEYPPQPGGVSDYTRLVAEGLAAAGESVHVFAPPTAAAELHGSARVHRLQRGFSPRGLGDLGAALDALPPPRRLLVQYVPHAFGLKAMNLPLCLWLARRGRRSPGDALWGMFHEVHTPFGKSLPLRHNVLAAVTRAMAKTLARRADRLLVSIPAWADLLRGMLPASRRATPIDWLPIPSNVPTTPDPAAVERLRRRFTTPDRPLLIGHFGTFGPMIRPLIEPILRPLSLDGRCHLLLIGRGGGAYRRESGLRAAAAEDLSPQDAANHLAACDLLVQPYPDGATSRRSSLMAGLSLGVAVLTNEGRLSESVWRETGAVALAHDAGGGWASAAGRLLGDAAERAAVARRGRALYARRFAMEHTLDALRQIGGTVEEGERP